jgi:hypothetical protein
LTPFKTGRSNAGVTFKRLPATGNAVAEAQKPELAIMLVEKNTSASPVLNTLIDGIDFNIIA